MMHVQFAKHNETYGVIMENFSPKGFQLEDGGTLLSKVIPNFKVDSLDHYTIENIMAEISRFGMEKQFIELCLFDALIASTDRHCENWGIIYDGNKYRFAPLFDNGDALGFNVHDKKLELYASDLKAFQAFTNRTKTLIEVDGKWRGVENLLVIWQDVESRQKYHIGTLNHNKPEGLYSFTYAFDVARRGVQEAIDAGFKGIYEFELKEEAVTSKDLFHFFNKRLPNPKRSDFQSLLSYFGLTENASKMEFLRRTKGRLGTDSYELFSPIVKNNKDDTFELEAFIEGWQYYNGDKVLNQLNIGDQLKLKREPENDKDKFAVMILTQDDILLGYVAAIYSEFVSQVLDDENECNVYVSQKYPKAIPQMKVFVEIEGKCTFRPNKFSNDYSGSERELVLI